MAHIYSRPSWHEVKPKRRWERYRLVKEKPGCFLFPEGTPTDPGVPHYPICTKEGEVSCVGLLAAYRRLMVYGKRYPAEFQPQVRAALRRIVEIAKRLSDKNDPANVCNFVYRAERTLRERGLLGVETIEGGVLEMAARRTRTKAKTEVKRKRKTKMSPGECGQARNMTWYCYIPNVGVRFVTAAEAARIKGGKRRRKGVSGIEDFGEVEGVYRHCVEWKKTRAGWRCARYEPGPGEPVPPPIGELEGSIRRCVAYQTVYSPALGRYVRRCARYEPVW